MILSIEEILTYIDCPTKYFFKYIKGHDNGYINLDEKYDLDMHKMFYSIWVRLQNEHRVIITHLKRTWGTLWMENKTGYGILFATSVTWRDREDTLRKKGVESILKMFNQFSKEKCFPIAINAKYEVKINDDLTVTGVWDLIREVNTNGKKIVEIIDLRTDDNLLKVFPIAHDLKLGLDSYAFRQSTGEKEDRLGLYGSFRGKLNYTERNETQYALMLHTIESVAKSIKQEMFYSRVGAACHLCPYSRVCSSGNQFEEYIKEVTK